MGKASVLFPCLVLFLVIFAAGIFFSVLPCCVPLIYSYLYLCDLHVMQNFVRKWAFGMMKHHLCLIKDLMRMNKFCRLRECMSIPVPFQKWLW